MYNTIDHPYNYNTKVYNFLFHPLHDKDNLIFSIITNIFLSVFTAGIWLIAFGIINFWDDRKLAIWKEGQASKVQDAVSPIFKQNEQKSEEPKPYPEKSLPEKPPLRPSNNESISQVTVDLNKTSNDEPIAKDLDAKPLPPVNIDQPLTTDLEPLSTIPARNSSSPFNAESKPPTIIQTGLDIRKESAKEIKQVFNLIEILKKLAEDQKTQLVTSSDGKSYSIPKENDYGVTTWELECNGKKYEINEHKEGAYNGVKREGFIKRKELIKSAAEKFVKEKGLPNSGQILDAINKLDTNFLKTIYKEEYFLDTTNMRKGYSANEADIKAVTEYYSEKHKKCLELIAQFAKDVQHLISESVPKGQTFNLDDLDKMERECVLERNRPVIINTFFYKNRKFVNIQRPESPKTIPSTIRDRKGLANYVTTCFGEIKNGEVIVTSQAVRHSSFPPIAIKNKFLRQAYAVANFKQGLTDYVKKLIESRPELYIAEKPIPISWRAMMLFTPKAGDQAVRNRAINGEWKGESEIDQFGESLLPLRMFDGRNIPIQIDENKTVWVELETSCMNLGANPEAAGKGALSLAPSIKKEKLVNAMGFLNFLGDVCLFLEKLNLPLGILNDLEAKLCREKKEHQAAIDGLNSVLSQKLPELMKEYSVLEQHYSDYVNMYEKNNVSLEKNPSQAELHKKENSSLLKHSKKITQSQPGMRKNAKDLKSLEKKIYSSQAEIHKNENIIFKKYQKLKKVKTEIFKSINTEQIQSEVNAKFEEAIANASDEQEREKLTLARDIQQNLYEAKKLFYGNGYCKPEKVMDFQTIYIQTHIKMKRFIEFFCKSGEDRTGRVDDKVQERELFYAIHNRMPMYDSDFEEINKFIAPLIHQYSVSQNNTEQNSNARGKQIGKAVNTLLPAAIDDLHGKLAKEVFIYAKKLTPSDFVKNLL